MRIAIPKGTKDILPDEIVKYKYIENKFSDIMQNYGYEQIRFPVFESTELFKRGVGDTTDIVQKEMYTFSDKSGRSLTLRPEGTASVVRSYIENGMSSNTQPTKLFYNITAYRYENVQKGRYREFNQLGAEVIGSDSANTDVEIIVMLDMFFKNIGLKELILNINSIGCKQCRVEYNIKLKDYYKDKISGMCDDCKDRYQKNPMRLLDCKNEKCSHLSENAPKLLDNLCSSCDDHFKKVIKGLDDMNIPYVINKKIVRGLDYYERTVFEFVMNGIGAQDTVCGGGRYDGLVAELGGNDAPGIGFAMGVERLLSSMDKEGIALPEKIKPLIFFAYIGEKGYQKAREIVNELRSKGIYCEIDVCERSLKAQLKFADKKNIKYCVVLGDNEIDTNKAIIKNMLDQESKEVSVDSIIKRIIENKI
jgi:histidyl-tRNA synthetase